MKFDWKEKVMEIIKIHGYDRVKILEQFPQKIHWILKRRILTLDPKYKLHDYTVKEEMALIQNGITKKKSWYQIAVEMSRSSEGVRRQYIFIKAGLIADEDSGNYLISLKKEYKRLQSLVGKTEFVKRDKGCWTEEKSAKLVALVQKIGCDFELMTDDFKPFTALQLKAMYDRTKLQYLLPNDVVLLKELVDSGLPNTTIYKKHFFGFDPEVLRKMIAMIKNPMEQLKQDQIDIVSSGLAKSGKNFVFNNQIAGWTSPRLRKVWLYHEPSNQTNAIWSFERDMAIIRTNQSARNSWDNARYQHLLLCDDQVLKDRLARGLAEQVVSVDRNLVK